MGTNTLLSHVQDIHVQEDQFGRSFLSQRILLHASLSFDLEMGDQLQEEESWMCSSLRRGQKLENSIPE